MIGVNKENVKINAYDSTLEVTAQEGVTKKYHETIDLPE
jgi:HSP20 family protein